MEEAGRYVNNYKKMRRVAYNNFDQKEVIFDIWNVLFDRRILIGDTFAEVFNSL